MHGRVRQVSESFYTIESGDVYNYPFEEEIEKNEIE
jgi:hypothetical protein